MPKRSKIAELPSEVRAWLDKALVDGNFSAYEALSARLKDRGYQISKSAVHRHGEALERRLAAIRASTEAAKIIAESADDSEDAKSEALIAITQHELFESLNSLQEAVTADDAQERIALVSKAAKGISELVRASISRKKFAAQVRRDTLSEAAIAAEKSAKARGLSVDMIDVIKREILGLAA